MSWWRWCVLFSLLSAGVMAEEAAINRTQAAQLAQQKFGGKVISVDEVEPDPAVSDTEDAPNLAGTRFIVKLMQNGRVKVVNLDAQGAPVNNAP